jgi:hypothetical protein
MMPLDLERDFQLAAAEQNVANCSREELLACLRYAWVGWSRDRQNAEQLLSDALGLKVRIDGPLLPGQFRALASAAE